MALRIDSRGIAGEWRRARTCGTWQGPGAVRGFPGHGRALAPHADLRDVALRILLLRALTLWDNGRGRAAGLRRAANFDGGFGRAVRSIWRGV